MPVHRVPRAQLDNELAQIEREGAEDVVTLTPDGDEFVIVTKPRYKPATTTRPMGFGER